MTNEITEVEGEDVLPENKGEISLVINPADYGVAVDKAVVIEGSFLELTVERDLLRDEYAQVIKQAKTPTSCKQAKDLSKRIGKNRTKTVATYKVEKEVYLRGGQFIDALRNRDVRTNTLMEAELDEFAEHFDKIEELRLAKLATDRELELRTYTESIPAGLGMMLDEVYSFYLSGAKKAFDDKEEAARIIEENRVAKELADKIEADRLAGITAQAKIDADKKQAELEAELAAQKVIADKKEAELAIERKAAADLLKKQQDDADLLAEETAKATKIAEERLAAVIASEKIKSDKLLADLAKIEADKVAEKALADAKIEADKIASDKLLAAPDKEKLLLWIKGLSFDSVSVSENTRAESIANDIKNKFNSFKGWAETQINVL